MQAYSFQAKIITRGEEPKKSFKSPSRTPTRRPPNVIFNAAYNAREALTDHRTGEMRDYSKGQGPIEWKGIFTPTWAPTWMQDRETLWNAIEEREDESAKADRAQLARSWIVAIPHELNTQQRQWLICDFAREISRTGIVVDVAIHPPDTDKGSDARNYHAHFLLTTREISHNYGFGNKLRNCNKKEWLAHWKQRYAVMAARALQRAGYRPQGRRWLYGHRKLAIQYQKAVQRRDHAHAAYLKGRKATFHLGPHIKPMEKELGSTTLKGDRYRAIVAANIKTREEQRPNYSSAPKRLPRPPEIIPARDR